MRQGVISAAFALLASVVLMPEHLAAPPPAAPPNPSPPAGADATEPPAAPDEPEEVPPVRRSTAWRSPTKGPLARVAEAEAAKLATVKQLFADAHVAYPPAQMLLRGFKKEKRLELWAASRADAPLGHVTTYEICMASGELGPKRREGDGQVPEGFYTLTEYNPASHFHLAMLVSYPNLSDQILGDKRHPGNEIMIHGRCVSVGCLAMSDERIQEIWLAATALRYAGGVVHVHVFPSRDLAGLLAGDEGVQHHAFWKNLQEGYDYFEKRRRLPSIRIDTEGRYHFL
jgi:murein L,D-transpeptidase YafK